MRPGPLFRPAVSPVRMLYGRQKCAGTETETRLARCRQWTTPFVLFPVRIRRKVLRSPWGLRPAARVPSSKCFVLCLPRDLFLLYNGNSNRRFGAFVLRSIYFDLDCEFVRLGRIPGTAMPFFTLTVRHLPVPPGYGSHKPGTAVPGIHPSTRKYHITYYGTYLYHLPYHTESYGNLLPLQKVRTLLLIVIRTVVVKSHVRCHLF